VDLTLFHALGRPGAPPRPTELAGRRGEDGPHGFVELADAGEAGGEGNLRDGQAGRLQQQPRGVGPPGARQGERPRAELGYEEAVQVALGVAQAAGEAGDALAVHDAVGDQAHRPASDVGPHVPLGGAGNRVGQATLARAEAGVLGGPGGRVEAHMGTVPK